ncbi:MAG: hypothetical protein ACXVBE_10615, partial [Bdellovibrionota bacterium]
MAAVVAICWVFDFNMRKGALTDPSDFSLAGEWRFHNGPVPLSSSEDTFSETVVVPEPLREQIKEELKDEFWYQKTFLLPERFVGAEGRLALFLGGIKGDSEVFWNSEKIYEGGKFSLSIAQLSTRQLATRSVDLRVKVKKIEHQFPGIVHLQPVAIGNYAAFERHREFYIFDSGTKPLVLGTFKFCLFFLFSFLFLAAPKKSEYFSFALFVLFSALATSSYSRFLPIYSNFYLRNLMTFLATTAAFTVIPWVSADILRLKGKSRDYFKIYGASLALIAFTSTFWISDHDLATSLYQFLGRWLPVAVGLPSLIACAFAISKLDQALTHRRLQIFTFSFFLLAGT